jgi:hypothetical protein
MPKMQPQKNRKIQIDILVVTVFTEIMTFSAVMHGMHFVIPGMPDHPPDASVLLIVLSWCATLATVNIDSCVLFGCISRPGPGMPACQAWTAR